MGIKGIIICSVMNGKKWKGNFILFFVFPAVVENVCLNLRILLLLSNHTWKIKWRENWAGIFLQCERFSDCPWKSIWIRDKKLKIKWKAFFAMNFEIPPQLAGSWILFQKVCWWCFCWCLITYYCYINFIFIMSSIVQVVCSFGSTEFSSNFSNKGQNSFHIPFFF